MKSTLTTTAPTSRTSFRLLLQSELARRCARNAQYSLRAFAMHLGVDHATLSQWLRGRRVMTARTIEALGEKLGLARPAIQTYIELAARDVDEDPAAGAGLLAGETLTLIADWYHFAILELTHLDEFRADSRWIARVLDISVDEVNVALQRLLRLDMLQMTSADRWADASGDARASVDALDRETLDRRQHQAQRLSAAAVHAVPMTLREHSSITLAVHSAALPRAFELITRFRQQLVQLLRDGPADDVYQIEVAVFPVTTLKRGKENRDGLPGRAVADSGEGS